MVKSIDLCVNIGRTTDLKKYLLNTSLTQIIRGNKIGQ